MQSPSISRATQHAFTSVLLLVRHDDHAVVDRQSLRMAGFRSIRVVTSGVQAARILSGQQSLNDGLPFPDLVVCDEQLADMTGQEFLALLRSHPKLATFPVIVAINNDTPSVRRELEEASCSGLLLRPYSGDAFLNQLVRAAAMHPPKKNAISWRAKDTEAKTFDLALSRLTLAKKVTDQTAGQWYREGLLSLRHEQWGAAATAFQHALKEQTDHSDAARGLTVALHKRQEEADANPQQQKKHLSREQADVLKDTLLQASHSNNPAQAITAAIAAFDESDPIPGSPAALAAALAAERVKSLNIGDTAGTSANGGKSVSPSLHPGGDDSSATPADTSTGIALLPELREPSSSGISRRFPLLRDAVNIAKVTLGLYKIHKK